MNEQILQLAIPSGRMRLGVDELLSAAGLKLTDTARNYRPTFSDRSIGVKTLKPQSIALMVANGSRDLGFTGRDWVEELGVDVVELLDTRCDPVSVVAAMPEFSLVNGELPRDRPLRIASEYAELTKRWIVGKELTATFVRSYGATEVYPPEDADLIVDNTATGSTLRANNLVIVDTLLKSSTRLIANRQALEVPEKRARIERICLLLQSVLDARDRVMLEVNVTRENLDNVCLALPCMRAPTIAQLSDDGFAVKAAVPRNDLPTLIPSLKLAGGSDVVVTRIEQIVA